MYVKISLFRWWSYNWIIDALYFAYNNPKLYHVLQESRQETHIRMEINTSISVSRSLRKFPPNHSYDALCCHMQFSHTSFPAGIWHRNSEHFSRNSWMNSNARTRRTRKRPRVHQVSWFWEPSHPPHFMGILMQDRVGCMELQVQVIIYSS
jgi:hypothetical protein